MKPAISVIIPVYNTESYLERCLKSILSQSFTDIELLLVDDGSTDRSGAICDEYAVRDNRIKVLHQENGGVSSARNLGLDQATGEYVIFADADDYWVTDKALERLYGIAKTMGSTCSGANTWQWTVRPVHFTGFVYPTGANHIPIGLSVPMNFWNTPSTESSSCGSFCSKDRQSGR